MAKEDIAIMAQDEIQVYANDYGTITIKSVSPADDDQLVAVTIENVDNLIAALKRAKAEAIAMNEAEAT